MKSTRNTWVKWKMIVIGLMFSVIAFPRLYAADDIRYSLVAVDMGKSGVYLSWEWDGQDKISIMRREGEGKFKEIARVAGTYFLDSTATRNVDIDYYVRYLKDSRRVGRSNTVFGVERTESTNPTPAVYTFKLPGKPEAINPAVGVFKKGRFSAVWRVGVVGAKLFGFLGNEKLFELDTRYRDVGESGGVIVPFLLWDLDGDGKDEFIARTGKVGTDTTYISIIDPLTRKVYSRIPFPEVVDWNHNQVHYLAVAHLDGVSTRPQIIAQVGVHKVCHFAAFNVDEKLRMSKRWNIITDDEHLWGGAGHGIFPADVDSDGRDEVLFGTVCVEGDGSVKWFCGKTGRDDKHDGYVAGHADVVSVGDVLPDEPGLEVMYCVEGGAARHKRPGTYLVKAGTGKIIWYKDTGHTDIGWLADLTDKYVGLEVVAWSKRDRTWRIYSPFGDLLFSEEAESKKYQHPIRWDGDLLAEVIVREGNKKELCKFIDEEFVSINDNFFPGYTLGRRFVKGDLVGDTREELVLTKGQTAYVMTNTALENVYTRSLRQNLNYREFLAVGAASYTYYPFWLYERQKRLVKYTK